MVRYRSQEVEVGGAVYQMRAQSKEDGRVQVTVRGGGEATRGGWSRRPITWPPWAGRSARWPGHSAGGPGR
jgi:hypothetical protein